MNLTLHRPRADARPSRSRRRVATGVSVALAVALAGVTAPAARADSLSGSGTASDPYLIASATDLDAAAAGVNSDASGLGAAVYRLSADIDYAGATFASFTDFRGTFDGNGHTISNIVYSATGSSADSGFFVLAQSATITNLHLDHVTSTSARYAAGLAGRAFATQISGVSVSDATITSSGEKAGGLIGEYQANDTAQSVNTTSTISNSYFQGAVTAVKMAGGIAAYTRQKANLVNNLVDADLTVVTSGGTNGTNGVDAGLVVAYPGSPNSGSITGNVALGGSITYSGKISNFIGRIAGRANNTGWTATDNLALEDITLSGAVAPSDLVPGPQNQNGTSATAAELAQESTYKTLGWDFGTAWVWNSTLSHPVPDATTPRPTITVQHPTVYAQQNALPSAAAILDAAGATTSSGSLSLDLTAVDGTTTGTYTATVSAKDGDLEASDVTLTIVVVPVVTISTVTTTVSRTAGTTMTSDDLVSAAGASLNVEGTLSADLSDVDLSTAGTYTATLHATDSHGFTAAPVSVTVTVVAATVPVISVTTSALAFPVGAAPTPQQIVALTGATIDAGSLDTVDLSGVDFGTAGSTVVTLTGADGDVHATPVPVTITVVAPAVTISGTVQTAQTVMAALTSWSPAPASTSYQWLLDGSPISGATSASYTVPGSAQGSTLAVKVTVTGTGYSALAFTSTASTVAVPLSLLGIAGSGIPTDPFQISSAADLDAAAAAVNADAAGYGAASYRLTADIDYAGATFASFTDFRGTFDGNGHTISNIVYSATGSGTNSGFFVLAQGATIANLHLDHVTSTSANYAAGLAGRAFATQISGVSVTHATVTSTGEKAGGLIGEYQANDTAQSVNTPSTLTNSYFQGTVTAARLAGGITAYSRQKANLTNNLVDADLTVTTAGGSSGTNGVDAGLVVAYAGTPNSGAITGNVALNGSVTYSGAIDNYVGRIVGRANGTGWTATNNLALESITLGGAVAASVPGNQNQNGTSATAAELAQKSTYTALGWDFGTTWVWDDTLGRPVPAAVPATSSAPTVTVSTSTLTYQVGALPSAAALLTATGAATTSGTLAIDASAVDASTPGTYTAYVRAVAGTETSAAVPVRIAIVPVVAIHVTSTTLTVTVGSSLTAAALIAATGATINVTGTIDADLAGVDTTTAGSYTATLRATDSSGFSADPVAVTVVVVAVPVISVSTSTLAFPVGAAPTSADVLALTGASISSGSLNTVDLSGVDFTQEGTATVKLTGSADGTTAAPVDVTVTVVRPVVTVDGTAIVGGALSASITSWSPAATSTAYQWLLDDAPVAGATAGTWTVPTSAAGHHVSVRVVVSGTGYEGLAFTSTAATVIPATIVRTSPVTVSGTSRVGGTLTVKVGTWTPAVGTVSVQWLRGGRPIAGATNRSYTPVVADLGTALSVRVTVAAAGYTTLTSTSASITVAKGVLAAGSKVVLRGKAKAGKKLKAVVTTTAAHPKLTYRWYAGAKKIKKAKKRVFVPAKKYRGKKIRVKVVVTTPGYDQVTLTSKKVKIKRKH